ncbi:hypothetical protein Peur_005317 [Populus x canadensis]
MIKVTPQTFYPPDVPIADPRLTEAYMALQAWKHALTSDPNQFTAMQLHCFIHLKFLYELDISNSHFSGPFPGAVFFLHSLKCLDVRFNEFEGSIPPQLFDLKLDALSIKNNRFQSTLPDNLGNSPVSVFVVANNDISGCIPPSLANMAETLDEIVLSNMD